MSSLSSGPSESLLNRIWGVFARIISKMLTPFRWLKVRLGSKTTTTTTSSHTSNSNPEATIIPAPVLASIQEDPSLRARFTQIVNKAEAFRKYQVSSSILAAQANSVILGLQHAKQQYSDHPLSVKSLEDLEKTVLEFEKALQSEIEFQTSHLTSILSEKIVALQPKITNLSEGSEKQIINKKLQDIEAALKKENASIVGLSGSDQELAYTSEARRCFITQLCFQIETVSCDIEKTEQIQKLNSKTKQKLDQIQAEANKRKEQIETDERQQQEALRKRQEENQKEHQKEMASQQLTNYQEEMRQKCIAIQNIVLLPFIGMKRPLYQKALDLHFEELSQAAEKFKLAQTKEEIDAAAHEYAMIQQRVDAGYYHQNAQNYNKVIQGTPEPSLPSSGYYTRDEEAAKQQYPAFASAFSKHKSFEDTACKTWINASISDPERKRAHASFRVLQALRPKFYSPKSWCEPTQEEFQNAVEQALRDIDAGLGNPADKIMEKFIEESVRELREATQKHAKKNSESAQSAQGQSQPDPRFVKASQQHQEASNAVLKRLGDKNLSQEERERAIAQSAVLSCIKPLEENPKTWEAPTPEKLQNEVEELLKEQSKRTRPKGP